MFKRVSTLWIITAGLLALIFGVGIICGWFLPAELKLQVMQQVLVKFQGILVASSNDWSLALRIFWNNLLVAGLVLISAIIPPLPVLLIFSNGVIIGIFGDALHHMDEIQPGIFWHGVVSLIPHGIFELSAIFLSGSFGLVAFLKLVAPKLVHPELNRKRFLLFTLKWFCLVIVPLLLVAGFMEVFVSTRVADGLVTQVEIDHDPHYAVTINTRALAENNCVPATPNNLVGLADSMLAGLYDPAVAGQLKQISTIPHWQITYTCPKDTWFTLTSFPADQWTPDQAQQFTEVLLNQRQANFTHDHDSIDTKLDGIKLQYMVTALPNRTIMVAQTDLSFQPLDLIQP